MYNFSNAKRGEALISMVVGVVILAIAIAGVSLIMVQNRTIEEDYAKNNTKSIIEANTVNIMRKIDTSSFAPNDIFYLCKFTATHVFWAFSGTVGERCKYLDSNGNPVTYPSDYEGVLYTRTLSIEQGDSSF